jgi:hypothetical protein
MSIYDMEAPVGNGGKYLKFKDGDKHRVRLFGDPTSYEAKFPDQDPKIQFASLCIWRNKETKTNEPRVLQFGWTIQKALRELAKDDEWGNPTEFDIEISATGEKLERKYIVLPKPKVALTEAEKKVIAECDWDLAELVKPKDSGTAPAADTYDPFESE